MKIIGLVSTYCEGPLALRAIESLTDVCDLTFIFEGPAGQPLPDEDQLPQTRWDAEPLPLFHRGAWLTDAQKRTEIVRIAQTHYVDGEPLWGVWVDGDEILFNGEYLRDWLQSIQWRDEERREEEMKRGVYSPTAGFPIRLIELDGTIMVCRAKVIRIDLIDRYLVSSSGIRFKNGMTMAEGNLPQNANAWFMPHFRLMEKDGRLIYPPPLPGEPFLLHRPALRHPKRVGLRMHEQELSELKKMGVLPEDYQP